MVGIVACVSLWSGCETREMSPSPFHVYSTVDTSSTTVGAIVRFQVWAKGKGERIIDFSRIVVEDPDISVVGKKTVRGEFKDDVGVEFEIAFWDTGSFVLPAYSVDVISATEGSVKRSVSTDPITVTVETVISDPQPTLRDVKPPVPIPMVFPVRLVLSLALILLLLGSLVWLWRKRVSSGKPPEYRHEPLRSPYEIARERLVSLGNHSLSNGHDLRQFYAELSTIVREYLENQYFVRIMEMTTEEIEKSRALITLDDDLMDKLLDVLKRADLVKFARFEPMRERCLDDHETVVTLLDRSRIDWLAPRKNHELEAV